MPALVTILFMLLLCKDLRKRLAGFCFFRGGNLLWDV